MLFATVKTFIISTRGGSMYRPPRAHALCEFFLKNFLKNKISEFWELGVSFLPHRLMPSPRGATSDAHGCCLPAAAARCLLWAVAAHSLSSQKP